MADCSGSKTKKKNLDRMDRRYFHAIYGESGTNFEILIITSYLLNSHTVSESQGDVSDWSWNLTLIIFAMEKEMATHSSILAWGTPRTEEPSRLQSMRSQESYMT